MAVHIRNDSILDVKAALLQHLPQSLPLLRRFEFMSLPGGSSPTSYVLASAPSALKPPFAAAYLDFSRGPESEMWMFSSIEAGDMPDPDRDDEASRQILDMFRKVGELEREYLSGSTSTSSLDSKEIVRTRETPGIVCVGAMDEKVLEVLKTRVPIEINRHSEPFYRFLFTEETLVPLKELPAGYSWSTILETDIELVISRTKIPRRARTMKLLPSLALKFGTNPEPIAWVFLGPDGSLTSLHCEEGHRGKGLAKTVAVKIFREQAQYFPTRSGLQQAYVLTTNEQSIGVCKSIGGLITGKDYWTWVNLLQ